MVIGSNPISPSNIGVTMGGYTFGHYKEPCPNCGSVVRYSWFAGDHYDEPVSRIYCDNKKCGAWFIKDKWEAYNEEKHGKDYYISDVRSGV